MKLAWFWRALTAIALVLLVAWFVRNTEWIEVDETAPAHGAAVDDKFYALRALMAATDSRFEVRTTLEPLPPPSATLVLDSLSWNIFPERDAALKAWVEAGGHLVFSGSPMSDETLRWVPLDFHRWSNAQARVCAAEAAASAPHPGADDEEDEDEDDKGRRPGSCAASSWTPGPAPSAPGPRSPDAAASAAWVAKKGAPHCALLHEIAGARPAFEPGREMLGCLGELQRVRPTRGVAPSWGLVGRTDAVALRVPVGRGEVTGSAIGWPINNQPETARVAPRVHRALVQDDNALIVAAILDLPSHRPVVFVEDEAREPLRVWLWGHARAPLLLALAAIALALWRMVVRFGPREAALVKARRSMGEQVRGTGAFIAGHEPAALHAATREALDAAARAHVDGWASLDEPERVDALLARVALARADLVAALRPAPKASAAQWLAAASVLEQARRALLRAPVPHP